MHAYIYTYHNMYTMYIRIHKYVYIVTCEYYVYVLCIYKCAHCHFLFNPFATNTRAPVRWGRRCSSSAAKPCSLSGRIYHLYVSIFFFFSFLIRSKIIGHVLSGDSPCVVAVRIIEKKKKKNFYIILKPPSRLDRVSREGGGSPRAEITFRRRTLYTYYTIINTAAFFPLPNRDRTVYHYK